MAELTVLFYSGRHRSTRIYMMENGVKPVQDFIEKNQQSRQNDINRFIRTSKRICDVERPHREQFCYEKNGIYAIKAHQVRVYGFFDGQNFIMCHAVFKKQDKARKEDLEKTDRIREEYKQRKETKR
jgi:hypothetical protein